MKSAAAVFIVSALFPGVSAAQAPTWDQIAPIFAERCVICHSGEAAPSGLRLDTFEAALLGGANGPVVVAGAPLESELFRRITGQTQPQMPLAGDPLSAEQIAAIEGWILGGLQAGTGAQVATVPAPRDPTAPINFADVEPIFLQRCVSCHSTNGVMGRPPEGLMLDTYENIIRGGERLAVVPGSPLHSEIIRRVEGLTRPQMPLDGPAVDPAEIELLTRWIAAGAPNAAGEPAPVPVGGEIRLRGILTGPNEIDGAAFLVGPQTRIDDRPAIGEAAEVEAVVGADGTVNAIRLRDR